VYVVRIKPETCWAVTFSLCPLAVPEISWTHLKRIVYGKQNVLTSGQGRREKGVIGD
jgi:hypothetical protein